MARRKRQSDEAPGWVWMLFGLGIGLIIAFGVYINMQPSQQAPAVPPQSAQPPPAPAQRAAEPVAEAPATPETVPETEPQPEPVAEEETAEPYQFEFYEMLPSFEVIIPEVESTAARTEDIMAVADPGVYVVQAGAFGAASDAETRRAQLALLGVESRIQRVMIDDQTFHRVRIGPIEDLDELNAIRARLRGANIESMVMRMAQ